MCGIAGILKVHPPGAPVPPPDVAIPESWLDVLDESIKHRGPDGQGRFRDRATRPDGTVVDVALVHRRLAIIDLACGEQPMVSERGPHPERPRNGRVAVVFNGCIYNHRELRQQLERAGHRFVTDHSDTEVLIHGWREWGRALFEKLDGMFAVGLWDSQSGTMTLARDAFGEKPLYCAERPAVCVFASTYSGVRSCLHDAAATVEPRSDPLRVGTWLQFGWDQVTPFDEFGGVTSGSSRVFPRSSAIDNTEEHWPGRWVDVLNAERNLPIGTDEVADLLSNAVQSRLLSDVPVGVFLSGGIDSALVACFAKQATRDVTAFTVRMPDSRFDESEAAAATASHIGLKHEILDCRADPAADLTRLTQQLGLPFGDSSLLPTHWVSAAARSAVKVALGGDGGDEVFLGYERHRALRALREAERMPASLNRLASRLLGGPATARGWLRPAARFFDAAANHGYKDLMAIFPESLFRGLVGPDLAERSRRHHGLLLSGRAEDSTFAEATALRADLLFYLPEDLLRKTDTASMAVAVEVRAPFLARDLIDRMLRVPIDVLMPGGERKGLLKAVARTYLPDAIVDRPKMGFSIPIGEWFRTDYGGMKQLLLDTLNSADPFPENLLGFTINRTFVAKMVADHMDGKRDHSQRLYMLLVLAIWAEWLRGLK